MFQSAPWIRENKDIKQKSAKSKHKDSKKKNKAFFFAQLTGILLLYPLMKPLVVPQNTYSEGYRFLKSCL